MQPIERTFDINGYYLAAKEWNPGGKLPVIACHGWLDNAASFDRLAPLLTNSHTIALDMPGHGLSAHKSPQASYAIWADLLDILAVADSLGWQQFYLLGHSRGAMMSMLLAAAMPERVKAMVLLDAALAQPVEIADTAQQLRKFLLSHRTINNKKPRYYDSIEQALEVRCRVSSMSADSARGIVERALQKTEQGYCWRTDPQLQADSALKLSRQHNDALVKAVTTPNRVILAEQGLGGWKEFADLIDSYDNLNNQTLSGGHHFHLEQAAEAIATISNDFFQLQTTEAI